MRLDKIPPQATEVEKAILGLFLIMPDELSAVRLSPEMFYNPKHGEIYKLLTSMYLNNELIDILTLTERFKKLNIDTNYAAELMGSVETTANASQLADFIQEKYISRELIKYGQNIITQAYDSDPFQIISETQQLLASLSGVNSSNTHHISESLIKLRELIDKNYKGDFKLTGLPTGFIEFDRISSGLQKSDLIVIAGETSQGKTSLALNIAGNAAIFNHRVALYSYEMNELQLTSRLVSAISEIPSSDILYRKLNDSDFPPITKAINDLYDKNIFIDDVPTTSYEYLEKSIRAMVLKEKIELVIIDYLQLIKTIGKNKAEATADIANGLKGLSKTLDIPIILLSQLARDRSNPKPSMGRLKNSGDIEASADIVWLVYRPEYYGITEFECNGRTYPSEGAAQMIIAKGRNIGIFDFVASFNKQLTKFEKYKEKESHYAAY